MIEISEDKVHRIALMLGPQSACARAIEDAERRRNAGQEVAFYVVGPKEGGSDAG